MSSCDSCGTPGVYNSGFTVECSNEECVHFTEKQALATAVDKWPDIGLVPLVSEPGISVTWSPGEVQKGGLTLPGGASLKHTANHLFLLTNERAKWEQVPSASRTRHITTDSWEPSKEELDAMSSLFVSTITCRHCSNCSSPLVPGTPCECKALRYMIAWPDGRVFTCAATRPDGSPKDVPATSLLWRSSMVVKVTKNQVVKQRATVIDLDGMNSEEIRYLVNMSGSDEPCP